MLSDLRVATGETHRQLEDAVGITKAVADVIQYGRLLQTFLGFYRPLESRLTSLKGWEERGVDWSARQKTPWLEKDLRALGLTAAEVAALPICPELPSADTLFKGFGCLYVMEGATLGGRQITGLLADSPVPAGARRFFAGYGAETGARWREYGEALETVAATATRSDRAEIVRAAEQTFTCLHRWITQGRSAHE